MVDFFYGFAIAVAFNALVYGIVLDIIKTFDR